LVSWREFYRMWGHVTAEELEQVKTKLGLDREAMLTRHAQELSALDTEVAYIDTITRLLEDFAQKYRKSPSIQEEVQALTENATEDKDGVEAYTSLRRAVLGR
jgi:hypothetical protein